MSSEVCRRCGCSPEEAAQGLIEEEDSLDPGDFGDLVCRSRQIMSDRGFCSVMCQVKYRREESGFDPEDPDAVFESAKDL